MRTQGEWLNAAPWGFFREVKVMEYRDAGVCPRCGKTLREAIRPNNKTILMACDCELEQRRDMEHKRESAEKKLVLKNAEEQFLKSVGPRYADKTLQNYKPDPKGADKMHLQLIESMAKDFMPFIEKGVGGLVLGGYGCGKTHLEVGLGRELIRQGYSVKFWGASRLYMDYMEAFSWKLKQSPADVIEQACDCDLLILDDLGINTLSTDKDNFAKFIYILINHRYNQKKPILISTNLREDELVAAVTMRVYDRIKAMTFCVTNKRSSMRGTEAVRHL